MTKKHGVEQREKDSIEITGSVEKIDKQDACPAEGRHKVYPY